MHWSIQRKLTLTIGAVALLVLMAACLIFYAYEFSISRQQLTSRAETLTEVISGSVIAPLAFGDAKSATEALTSLKADESVTGARVFTKDGAVLADYRHLAKSAHLPEKPAPADREAFDGEHYTVSRWIKLDNQSIGCLYLETDNELQLRQLRSLGWVIAVLIFSSVPIALLMGWFLQRRISRPLQQLAEITQQVSQRSDYSIRVTAASRDEIGILFRQFNLMLKQIEERDAELKQANDQLEKRVLERTLDLQTAESSSRQSAVEAMRARDLLEGKTRQLESQARELATARDLALASTRAKANFLANMSHEIRTPMNGIVGMSELLSCTPLTASQKEYTDTILSSANALLSIINDILDISKIEAGKFLIQSLDFDLQETLDSAMELLRVQAIRKRLYLTATIQAAVPTLLKGDAGRLRQVLINLIGNALKFTNRGGVRVVVTVTKDTEAEAAIRVAVIDTGEGIGPGTQARLFQPFTQADDSNSRRHGGTGLGLAISKQLVELMGGEIGMISKLGDGSAFWFSLVLKKQPGSQRPPRRHTTHVQPSRPKSRPEVPSQPLDLSGIRVLIADDTVVNQRVAALLLMRTGVQTSVVDTGRKAVDSWAQNNHDLILMDCQMPGLDGYEATREIRSREKAGVRIPIIAMTAHAMLGDREKCLEAGMDDFIAKPIQADELRGKVEAWAAKAIARRDESQDPVLELSRFMQLVDIETKSKAPGMTRDIVAAYRAGARDVVTQLSAAQLNCDAEAIRGLAHKVGGSASNLGGTRVSRQALLVERAAEAKNLEVLPPLIEALVVTIQELDDALVEKLASMKNGN